MAKPQRKSELVASITLVGALVKKMMEYKASRAIARLLPMLILSEASSHSLDPTKDRVAANWAMPPMVTAAATSTTKAKIRTAPF